VAMTYAITIPYFIGMCAQTILMVRMYLAALERLLGYRNLPQESERHKPGDPSVTVWPKNGELEFQNVRLRYQPQLPLALDNVSFKLPGGARAGVIGRTGSGKSTLVACLFRLHEAEAGQVMLDGMNALEVGLHCLRRCITVVPQDPVLMAGTLRTNLDPFGTVTLENLTRALQRTELAASEKEAEATLDRMLQSGGSNLSVGERQLICLARAAISGPTILILDEPTSSADPATDAKLQAMVRSCFSCTTLCIAHRISTIVDSDYILVMQNGKVKEFGAPAELCKNVEGEFRSMCRLSGIQFDGTGLPSRSNTITKQQQQPWGGGCFRFGPRNASAEIS